ncbi:MAG: PIN domain-containing protein [Microbacterium sp.]|uniref:PIN domain-containing protein n=1 Tax=Microbacterium sp. TaxID=51671 RepID=UPI0039E2FAA1
MAETRLAVLDTSAVITPLQDYSPYADLVCLSAVTIGELAFGLHAAADPLESAARERRYRDILTAFTPIAYDAEIAHEYGAIAAAVRSMGRNPRARTADLMIAATARHLDAALLTRNPADFAGLDGIVTVVDVT